MATAILKLVETPVGTLPENVVAATPRMPLPAAAPIAPIKPKPAWALWIEARAAAILPTLLMVVVLLGVWQALCSAPDARFPSPVKVWTESREVIVHPLKGVSFNWETGVSVTDGADVGILVHIATSLKRVAIGYSLSAVVADSSMVSSSR